jgi:hypothetical protein
MGTVWKAVKAGLALALSLAEKGVFVLQGHGDPRQVRYVSHGVVSYRCMYLYWYRAKGLQGHGDPRQV